MKKRLRNKEPCLGAPSLEVGSRAVDELMGVCTVPFLLAKNTSGNFLYNFFEFGI